MTPGECATTFFKISMAWSYASVFSSATASSKAHEKGLGYTYEGLDRTLDSHIKNLRRKIEPDPAEPTYIQTVYGVGYRLRGEQ